MRKDQALNNLACLLALALLVSLCPQALAQHVNYEPGYNEDAIVIRRTIPYPRATQRAPLTSDRLNTASTRYIDARRGLRPYSSVGHGHHSHCYSFTPAYDDHFGISRAIDRPYSYSQRAPRTGVTQYVSTSPNSATATTQQTVHRTSPERAVLQAPEPQRPAVDMAVRVHEDATALPTTRGAVIIGSDGRVIQIGD